ncbi:hypothetical protein ACFU98_16630 [Streptomyces sp. NPDC057575]|uniref:hypothetical protein n=1 Tax=unclassified Streptomyces TaxID=2593676 RepID=UPI0036B9B2DE
MWRGSTVGNSVRATARTAGGPGRQEFGAAAFEGRAWFTGKTSAVTEGLHSATFTHDPTLIG